MHRLRRTNCYRFQAVVINNKIPVNSLNKLASELRGTVVTASDPDYDEARSVWNAMIDRHPALVVRAHDISDVPVALKFARNHELPMAIRGGGHSVAGHGTVEAGIVLDLRACNGVSVDPLRRLVTTGPGSLLGELDRAASLHGLAVPLGVISQTGVAGLCLGGGFGWLTRAHGLTADHLVAAELVTPEGEFLRADAESNPELLWGLRGGGGNFGVVTSFTFSATEIPRTPFAGNLIYRFGNWSPALRALRVWSSDLPDAMTVIATVLVPPEEWELGSRPILVVGFVWADPDQAAGAVCLERFTSLAPPDGQDLPGGSWPEWQSSMDEFFPKGVRAYWKNTSFNTLDDEAVNVLVAHGNQLTWPGTAFDVHVMGGAVSRVPSEATAFPDRSSAFWINIYGFWNDAADDSHHMQYIRDFHRDMGRFSSGGEYINFSSTDERARHGFNALGVYGSAKLARLTALKQRYDPHNLLRLNHNIAVPGTPG